MNYDTHLESKIGVSAHTTGHPQGISIPRDIKYEIALRGTDSDNMAWPAMSSGTLSRGHVIFKSTVVRDDLSSATQTSTQSTLLLSRISFKCERYFSKVASEIAHSIQPTVGL
jgi:hypothetical protein